ncbi:MAG TPA: hypothetical protein VHM27_02990 [Rhizomicrobium sp.]|nr:hypothetical protein [Rhizomicrobium sp.]
MKRRLETELLDHLPADDPAAMASRRDLDRINLVMRQPAIMAATLCGFPPPRLLLDLGGGDGRFLLRVARQLPEWRGVTAVIADRQAFLDDATRAAFTALGWRCELRQGDIFDVLQALEDGALLMANLFLHHLDDAALGRLFAAAAARAAGLVACEPHRGRWSLAGSHMVMALGANAVTRHDAVASVRAGFRDGELSALWPQSPGWALQESRALPFSHLFVARRHGI